MKKVSCLKPGIKMRGFCLKRGQGLKTLAAHLHPNCTEVPPGGGGGGGQGDTL